MPAKKVFMLLSKKSNPIIFFLLCFLSTVFLSYKTKAQTGNSKRVYISVNYIKTPAGKGGAYLDLLKNYSKKVWEYNFKQGRSMGTYVSSMVMPSGATAEYDFTVITVSTDLKFLLDDSVTTKVLLKKLNPEYSDNFLQSILDQYLQARTLIKRDIFTAVAEVDPTAPATKYYTVDYMKTAPGKADDYVKLEKEVWMPIHKERIKMGILNDWLLLEKQMPYSARQPYDFETVNFITDINSVQDTKFAEAVKKVYPNMDMTKMLASTDSSRTIVKEELWKTEFYVDATNTKK